MRHHVMYAEGGGGCPVVGSKHAFMTGCKDTCMDERPASKALPASKSSVHIQAASTWHNVVAGFTSPYQHPVRQPSGVCALRPGLFMFSFGRASSRPGPLALFSFCAHCVVLCCAVLCRLPNLCKQLCCHHCQQQQHQPLERMCS